MTNDFDPNWPHGHVTRSGKPAEIIYENMVGDHPIVAIVKEKPNEEYIIRCQNNGRLMDGGDCPYDIFNAPAPKKTFEYWLNFYPGSEEAQIHQSKEDADGCAGPTRIACKRVVITEGEFDE